MRTPIIGLMTTDLPQESKRAMFDNTWQLLAEAGQAQGVQIVFFDPRAIHLSRSTIPAITWTANGWAQERFPIPRVIIDNVFVHVARTDPHYKTNKRALRQAGYTILNPRLPDKWGVWSKLLESESLRPFLPDTTLVQPGLHLANWFDKHPSLFLKPTRGSGGQGILHMEQLPNGSYKVIHDEKVTLLTKPELRHRLYGLVKDPKKKYLLQQGLSLLDIDNRKVDIRIVLHRDEDKRWQPIATVPRLGGTGRVVTNLEQGGEARTLEWLHEEAAKQKIRLPQRAEIEKVAIAAAESMTELRPTLAFLGIDIAPDIHGRLWLLDINPRPGRKVLQDEDKKSAFRCLIGYAKTLLREKDRRT